jgi:hypothetical protein
MHAIFQVVAVFAVALGAGLFAFGSYLDPRPDANNPAEIAKYFSRDDNTRFEASVARGVGIGFMVLGGLGLAVPWVNAYVYQQAAGRARTPPAPL